MLFKSVFVVAGVALLGACSVDEAPEAEVERVTEEVLGTLTSQINLWAQIKEIPPTFESLTPLIIAMHCGERLKGMEETEILSAEVREVETARRRNCNEVVWRNVSQTVHLAVNGA